MNIDYGYIVVEHKAVDWSCIVQLYYILSCLFCTLLLMNSIG